MSRKHKRGRQHLGALVLSDFDPGLGKLVRWHPHHDIAKVYLFERRVVVSRNAGCIFFKGSDLLPLNAPSFG